LSQDTPPQQNVFDNHDITRVDIRIKVGPHTEPEEESKRVLQAFLQHLQNIDLHVGFAPWNEFSTVEPWTNAAQISLRASELEIFFPRLTCKAVGTTWYSGVRLIHELPMEEMHKDALRWLKEEDHGLFERMLQCENTVEIGWFVFSSWIMEASVPAEAIGEEIGMDVGLRWKMISVGTREKIPP